MTGFDLEAGDVLSNGFFNPMLGAPAPSIISGGGIAASMAGPFEMDDDTIRNCRLVFGRTTVSCNDTKIDELSDPQYTGKLIIYAQVTHNENTMTLSVHADKEEIPRNTIRNTYRVLYFRDDGKPFVDYRFMPTIVAAD